MRRRSAHKKFASNRSSPRSDAFFIGPGATSFFPAPLPPRSFPLAEEFRVKGGADSTDDLTGKFNRPWRKK
jgi:hypothetical protein